MTTIEKNLKDICRKKGLSLTDVANRMGTDPSNLLSSIKGNPTIARLQSIAEALQINVSQLIEERPAPALGIAIIDGKTYQLSLPAPSTVQLPTYQNYSKLHTDIGKFVKKSITDNENASMMAMVETMEVFALIHNPADEKFHLSICYTDGKTLTKTYDKYYYAVKPNGASKDKFEWEINDLLEDITTDITETTMSRINTERIL